MDEHAALALLQSEVDRLSAGGVREIQLHFALSPNPFREAAHDRTVRFDERVCQLGSGVEALSGKQVLRRCDFSYYLRDGGYRELERELEDRSMPKQIVTRKRPQR